MFGLVVKVYKKEKKITTNYLENSSRYVWSFLGPVHTATFCTKTERKTSVFVKVFTLIGTKTPQKRRFSRTLSKLDIHKTEVFENAFEQCEHTKTEVFENTPMSNNQLHKAGVM